MGRAKSLFCGLALTLGSAVHAADAGREPIVVQDLHFGEVLFHFYQDDYFGALTRLLAAKEVDRLSHHPEEAELLLGGLYLSYGQHRLAGEIFQRMLADKVAPEFRDRAWYFMAKVWFQRGYYDDALGALGRIEGELPEALEADKQMLNAQVLMAQGRFAEAQALLERWEGPEEWAGYSQYNLGVALVRQEKVAEGAALLDAVGQLNQPTEEMISLQDKANVALGYAWLQAEQPALARTALQRVRLNGPFSNKALLGMGWAHSTEEDYRTALVPWMELQDRHLLDSAVQESLLATPYALAKLGADKQAADFYLSAIDAFTQELQRLDQSIGSISNGALLAAILAEDDDSAMGWYWRLKELPDAAETRYLYELMASHRFQEGMKNYRDLLFMQDNLRHWEESLQAFDDILETRQTAYDNRLPLIQSSLDQVDPEDLAARHVDLASKVSAIERNQDVVALADGSEQQNWELLVGMEPMMAPFLDDPEVEEMQDKQRFLKGLLFWNLSRDYKARLWKQKSALRKLEREVQQAQWTYHRVAKATREWPERFAALSARVATLRPRVERLRAAVGGALGEQRAFLEGVAVEELQAQKARLGTYMVQARFALASIYDRAAAESDAQLAGDLDGAGAP